MNNQMGTGRSLFASGIDAGFLFPGVLLKGALGAGGSSSRHGSAGTVDECAPPVEIATHRRPMSGPPDGHCSGAVVSRSGFLSMCAW